MKNVRCCVCGIEFGMPDDVHQRRLEDGRCFYCLNGHYQHFTDSKAVVKLSRENRKLESRVQELEKQIKYWEDQYYPYTVERIAELSASLTLAKRRVAGYKSQFLRLKRKQQEREEQ